MWQNQIDEEDVTTMGYKLKTKKAAVKRFPKSTASGKIKRCIQGHGHFLSKKGQKVYSLQGTTLVSDDDFARIDKLMPYAKAKRKRTKALKAAQLAAANAKAEANATKKTTGKEAK